MQSVFKSVLFAIIAFLITLFLSYVSIPLLAWSYFGAELILVLVFFLVWAAFAYKQGISNGEVRLSLKKYLIEKKAFTRFILMYSISIGLINQFLLPFSMLGGIASYALVNILYYLPAIVATFKLDLSFKSKIILLCYSMFVVFLFKDIVFNMLRLVPFMLVGMLIALFQ